MQSLMDMIKLKKKPVIKYRKKANFSLNRRFYIQLGGSLELLNIPQRFGIKLGDDLQKEADNTKNSATLLGCLNDWASSTSNRYVKDNFTRLKKIGLEELNKKKEKKENNSPTKISRESRTKTLSQLGGLFSLIGVLQKFDLAVGDDIQINQEAKINSMVLIGSLKEYFDQLSDIEIIKKSFAWKEVGYQLLKQEK